MIDSRLFLTSVLVSALVWSTLVTSVVAPFPDDHPYHFLNPYIDPWWETLTSQERKTIYAYWEVFEPTLISLADVFNGKFDLIETADALAKTKTAYLKVTYFGITVLRPPIL